MTDNSPLDPRILRAMLEELARGDGPSIAELRRDPRLAGEFRDERDMGPLRAAAFRVSRATPAATCCAPVSPPCPRRPIRSHSIQRAGPIQRLADATNHVLMFRMDLRLDERPLANARPVGVRDATTFPGLCNEHDTSLFREIETRSLIAPTTEQLFLLSYRAVLRELYAKRCQEEQSRQMVRMVAEDPGASPYAVAVAISHAYDVYVGTHHLTQAKLAHDAVWKTRTYDRFFRFITRRTRPVAFAVASFFTPIYDFSGAAIPHGAPRAALPSLTLDVAPDGDGTLISLAIQRRHARALGPILDRLERTVDEAEFIGCIWELALRNCENLVLAPGAWAGLAQHQRDAIERFFTDTIHSRWVPWIGVAPPEP